MTPYLSVIIPYYNAPQKLERLLDSIAKSKRPPPYEVIIVDDGSTSLPGTDFTRTASRKGRAFGKIQDVRVVTLQRNFGPAIARNRGASAAKGEFIVFLDGDVEVFPDTLYEIAKVFHDDPDVVALTGVWVKEQRSKDFFPNFKALRDWSYWINERDKSGYYFLFSTRIASIKRAVFGRLGGFDETYPAPLVEDIELTYRIARRYAIIFAPHVRVRHEFEGFWPIAKKYFLRAYYWTKLYTNRKKFDPVATTIQEAITTVSGVSTLGFFIISTISICATMGHVTPVITFVSIMFVLSFFVHVFLIRKFLIFIAKERGMHFMLKGFVTGLLLYCFIFAGAVSGQLRYRFSE